MLRFLLTLCFCAATVAHAGESDMNIPWKTYTDEVGKILKEHRKIDPKHNVADRPLHDPWDDIWKSHKKHGHR